MGGRLRKREMGVYLTWERRQRSEGRRMPQGGIRHDEGHRRASPTIYYTAGCQVLEPISFQQNTLGDGLRGSWQTASKRRPKERWISHQGGRETGSLCCTDGLWCSMSLFLPAAASQNAPLIHMRYQDPGATRSSTLDGLHELLMWTLSELLLYGLPISCVRARVQTVAHHGRKMPMSHS